MPPVISPCSCPACAAALDSPAAGGAARRLWCFGERLSERLAEREYELPLGELL